MATRHIRPYPIKLNPDQQDKMTDQELEAGLAPVYLNPALVASLLLMGYQGLGEGQIGHFVGLGPTQQVGQVLGDVGAADVAILRAICSMEVIRHLLRQREYRGIAIQPVAVLCGGRRQILGWIDEPPGVGGIGLEC